MSKDIEKPFWDHVEELKDRLKIILYSIIISTILFMVLPADFSFLENPLGNYKPLISNILLFIENYTLPPDMKLIVVNPMAPIELFLIASFVFGLIISMPIIVYEVYKFIDPALYPHEKRLLYGFSWAFIGLFVAGSLFGFFILLPFLIWSIEIFLPWVGAEPYMGLMDFYGLVFSTVILSGLSFMVPAFFVLLVRLGFLSTDIVTKNRPYLYGFLFILTALITPNGGPLADLALFIPIVTLMEAAVFIAKKYEIKRERRFRSLFELAKPLKRCEYCGYEMYYDQDFCPRCGRALH